MSLATDTRTSLQPLPEDFDRVLAVVAHPDDLEYGTSAAVHRWTTSGIQVSYLLATRGEAGIDTMAPEQSRDRRAQEERDGAAEVGASVEFLDYADGVVEYSVGLRRDIARVIRRVRPQVVVAMTPEMLMPWGLNQPDHRAVGLAALDACRDAGNRWIHRELLDEEGLAPWSASWVLLYGSTGPTHYVDCTGHVEPAVESLRAHRLYNAALSGDLADPVKVVSMVLEGGAHVVGDPAIEHAVLFARYAV